jgi:hypothetical protein
MAQTASHTTPLLHDEPGCGVKQLSSTPPHSEQNLPASATQTSSHATAQHDGSIEQTSSQHDVLLQPGPKRLAVKQSFVAVSQPCALALRGAAKSASAARANVAKAVTAREREARRQMKRRSRMVASVMGKNSAGVIRD